MHDLNITREHSDRNDHRHDHSSLQDSSIFCAHWMSVKQQFDISDEEMKTARICTSPRRFSRVDYISGFFLLPMMWLLVVLNWWKDRKMTTEKGKQMAKCMW